MPRWCRTRARRRTTWRRSCTTWAPPKLEAGEPHVERHAVNLNELVERGGRRATVRIAGPRKVEIGSAVPERRCGRSGDVTLIEQAVSNLVHNAVRYNNPGGHVAVVLERGRREPVPTARVRRPVPACPTRRWPASPSGATARTTRARVARRAGARPRDRARGRAAARLRHDACAAPEAGGLEVEPRWVRLQDR